jgi:phage terminase large subunit
LNSVKISLPEKLIDVFQGRADVRGAYGGRGSGKTRSFAKMLAVRGYMFGQQGEKGILLCGRQFMNSLDDSSLEECKRAIEEEPFLRAYYEIGDKYIKSKDGRISFVFTGLDRNLASVKSKGRILICWVDEAEPLTDYAFTILVPTLREEDTDWNAELWLTWNPKRKSAPVERFRNSKDPLYKVVELNWRDNLKFPAKSERERQRILIDDPDQYGHIWEGEFFSVVKGAYYAACINQAKEEKRISKVACDPLMTVRLFFDIGSTGKKADAAAIWAMQFIGREIRVLDYYEAVGQPLSAHVNWLRERGYTKDKAHIWLPHDGVKHDFVHDVTYESALKELGYTVSVIPNQGTGAALMRVNAGRRLFPSMWFNEETTRAGVEALGWYHERTDEERGIGLGPNHDWSSNAADAFGLACVSYELPSERPAEIKMDVSWVT